MSILDDFGEKLAVLQRWVRASEPLYQPFEAYDTGPVPETEMRRAEREFGVTLPPGFRAFLGRYGAGRAWPGNVLLTEPWGLTPASCEPFPLSAPMLGLCSPQAARLPADAQWEGFGHLLKLWEAVPKDHGVLQFCGYGCGIDAVLILNGPFAGRVWTVSGDAAYYGPFGGSEALHGLDHGREWVPTETPREYPFLAWYENWLDGELSRAGLHGRQTKRGQIE